MSRMGSTSQVTNCNRIIHETGKGVCVSRECPGHLLGNQSDLSSDILAGLGKCWKLWGNSYSRIQRMVVSFVFPCGYSCTLYAESFENLKSFGTKPVVPSSIPNVVLMMKLDDMNYICWTLILLPWTFNANTLIMNHVHVILLMNLVLLCKCTNAY